MNYSKYTLALVGIGVLSTSAWADTPAERDQNRDVNQQQRIEQGLKSGELSTKEAGQLERDQQRVNRMEARDLQNGNVSPAEQARLNAAQTKSSRDVYNAKHNATTGNPNSASSQRMQADVQRNANQEARISNGMQNGTLTNKEAGSLERGQAHADRSEANAASNGRVGAAEQHHTQRIENRQSNRVYNKDVNDTTK